MSDSNNQWTIILRGNHEHSCVATIYLKKKKKKKKKKQVMFKKIK